MHSVGHHVGLEVHDPELRPLQVGDYLALEIGFYDSSLNIGLRIEDMYTVVVVGGKREEEEGGEGVKKLTLERISQDLPRDLEG